MQWAKTCLDRTILRSRYDSIFCAISLTVNLSQFNLEADRYKWDTTQNSVLECSNKMEFRISPKIIAERKSSHYEHGYIHRIGPSQVLKTGCKIKVFWHHSVFISTISLKIGVHTKNWPRIDFQPLNFNFDKIKNKKAHVPEVPW